MLILNPERVELGSDILDRVSSVTIDRATVAPVEQWGGTGPWCRLADSTKRRVSVLVRQELGAGLDIGPQLGSMAELRVVVSPAQSDRARRRIRCTCVVVAVEHTLTSSGSGKGATRTVSLLAVSTGAFGGVSDPVVVEGATP